ncbi:DNA N-glycosylase and apurinic/apyrimidinic (AP) lyase [Steccherinum ochraceum]|uniref:Endonuclease III homolog n=1 Tax=Steccherinum ochraceum TaxID=92696 RepID=A0A4V2MVC9_9APHY|nr:DNA N-glycosylase and apurinic/apyrimidinic (AP) lyase [Steccherinum ochraceum]
MPSAKRAASPLLVARPSPYHASVTLFSNASSLITVDADASPRRSKRVKVDVKVEDEDSLPETRPAKKARTKLAPRASTSTVKLEEAEGVKSSRAKVKRETSASASPRKQKAIPQSLDTPHPAPPNWRDTYDTIKRMRSKIVAPVDTMGCDQAQNKETEPQNRRFATLVSLMLSSQTKDEVTDAAVAKLREALGGSITVGAVLAADESAISEAIAKVGFWRRKTGYIKQTAQHLQDDFDSDVPKTVDELCSLPGVGPKMAFLALQVAWNINVGIGVDVHVHRITNRLGWHKPPTKTPEQTRLNLQSWLPTELHPDINHMLVGFGQVVCLPVGPRCGECELSDGRCPSASKTVVKTSTRKVTSRRMAGPKVEIEVEDVKTEEVKITAPSDEPLSPLSDASGA